MKRFIALLCAVLFCASLMLGNISAAHADPMTAAMFGSAAYAYAQASGLTWIFGEGSTSGSASTWIENQVNSWLNGRDLSQVIGDSVLRAELGKLIVPYQIGVAIAEFINDLIDKHDITPDNITELSPGEINGFPLSSMSRNYTRGNGPQTSGLEVVSYNAVPFTIESADYSGGGIEVYYRGHRLWRFNWPSYYPYFYGWYPYLENGKVYFLFSGNRSTGGDRYENRQDFTAIQELSVSSDDITGQIQALMETDFSLPDFPDVGYEWEGTITGSTSDTNLDQLIGIINANVSNNNLDVTGEVVDPVVPPTPVPTRPPVEDILEGVNVQITQLDELEESLRQLGVYSGMIQSAVEQTRQAILDQNEWKDAELNHLLTLINIESQSDARLRNIYEDFKISLASIDDQTADVIGALGDIKEGINEQTSDILPTLTDIKDQQIEQTSDIVGALEGIQNKQDEQTGDIVGGLDDIKEGLNEQTGDIVGGIAEQTDVISGAIDHAISDSIAAQEEAIRDQTADVTAAQEATTEAVQSLEGTIVEALQPAEIDEKTFDLRELFPFCIPFDIYHLLQKFDGSPSAPHVQLPIVIPSIGFSYTMDLDFSAWNPVAAAMRTVELIVYALGLAWATSKVIKW